jgi:PEP-CTERM motif
MKNLLTLSTLGLLTACGATIAHADTVVPSTSVIYAAGSQSSLAGSADGIVPVSVDVNGATSYTFATTGTISLNSGGNINDADGANSGQGSSSSTGSGSISGMVAPGAGYLVGVFIGAGGPSGSAPSSLDFTTGDGTAFTSLSPLLNQVFYIGDGLTGDGTGTTQQFIVPTGATELYLGISDACGYNGSPSCYGDNSGSFNVTVNPTGSVTPIPEPSSLILFGTGILGAAGAIRRRFQAA